MRFSVTVDLDSRIRGCLIGGAIGDALGAPVEFLSCDEIRRRFGEDGIQEFAEAYGVVGAITDDTQMTLFTAEGLMRAHVRGATKGIVDTTGVVQGAYLRWLATQEPGRPAPGEAWLSGHEALHDRRAPGNTCLGALREGRAVMGSKGCGGVMRAAPAGMLPGRSIGEAFRLGCDVAAITHGHPSGYLSAGALAALINALLRTGDLVVALVETEEQLARAGSDAREVVGALEVAIERASAGPPSADVLAELGEGWVAEEALAMSVYCARVAEDFEHGVRLAVNHSGDSDSTGAITGNILGALWGREAIPERWIAGVELADVIRELAEDWCDLFVRGVAPETKAGRYPGS